MTRTGKVATWLELAAAPHSRNRSISLRVHALLQETQGRPQKGRDQCFYAVSVDGRWLYSGDGRLTVLKGVEAVDRFMHLINISSYESGEFAQIEFDCGKTAHCIAASRKAGLQDAHGSP